MPLVFDGVDKVLHLAVFSVVGLTVIWPSPGHFRRAAGLGILFAFFDEVHQYFVPGRHSELWDIVADAVGILLGCILGQRLFHGKDGHHVGS